ncbi:MAG: hypothetical protein QM754_15430 [Tepidisphaeraceae bacterium]
MSSVETPPMGWCKNDPNTFCNIGERDVDFLLLEELRCSATFRGWFLNGALAALGISTLPVTGCIQHSVHRTGLSTGETDLLVLINGTGGKGKGTYAVLIEDKIDACFSDRTKSGSKQTERYRAEITKQVGQNKWKAGYMLLVAPREYIRGVAPDAFDGSVSYEELSGWFAKAGSKSDAELAVRFEHRRQMVEAAINRWRRGWTRQADSTVSGLWERYNKLATADFSDLCMKYTGGEPPDSYTVSFACLPKVEGLPKCRIDHVMERGTVDILVSGSADQRDRLSMRLLSVLPSNCTLRKAGKSLGISLRVPPINRFGDAATQDRSVRSALEAVRTLKEWFERNWSLLKA